MALCLGSSNQHERCQIFPVSQSICSEGERWEEQRRFAASALKSLAVKKGTLQDKVFCELAVGKSWRLASRRRELAVGLADMEDGVARQGQSQLLLPGG